MEKWTVLIKYSECIIKMYCECRGYCYRPALLSLLSVFHGSWRSQTLGLCFWKCVACVFPGNTLELRTLDCKLMAETQQFGPKLTSDKLDNCVLSHSRLICSRVSRRFYHDDLIIRSYLADLSKRTIKILNTLYWMTQLQIFVSLTAHYDDITFLL